MIRRPPRSTLFPTRRSSDLIRGALLHRKNRTVDTARTAARIDELLGGGDAPRASFEAGEHWTDDVADRKSTRLNSSHANISHAVFCLKKKNVINEQSPQSSS